MRTILWCIGLVLLVAVTNRRTDPVADRALIEDAAGDSYSYLAMAEAAPDFPRDSLTFHHAQRFALPWTIGIVGRVAPVSLHTLFWIVVLVLECAILLVVASTLDTLGIRGMSAEFVLAMLAFNPWVFRQYVTFPAMANDLAFVLGLAITLRGLVRGSISGVVGGQIIASLSRQTGLALVPAVMYWLWRDRERWVAHSVRARSLVVFATAGIALAIYALTARIAARFALASENREHLSGLLAFLCVAAQPVLAGPGITGGSGERLVGLGLIAITLAAAIQLRDTSRIGPGAASGWRLAIAGILLGAGSLHHLYTRPELAIVTERNAFGALYAGVCAAMVLMMRTGGLHLRSARAEAIRVD